MDIKEISKQINENAHAKGFWDKGVDVPEKLMLIVSEVSEAMEADRIDKRANINGFYSDMKNAGIGKDLSFKSRFEQVEFERSFEATIKNSLEDELADAAIRIFDLATEMGIDLSWHIDHKVKYNANRPVMHGGKKY